MGASIVVNEDSFFTLGHGTPAEQDGIGTLAAVVSGDFLYVHDTISFSDAATGDGIDYWGFTIFDWPAMTYVSHHQFGGTGNAEPWYPRNMAVDAAGNVYFYTRDLPDNRMVKQNGETVVDISTDAWWAQDILFGPAWNPFDDQIYDIRLTYPTDGTALIDIYDTDMVYIDTIFNTGFTTFETDVDAVVFADGALWLSKTGVGGYSGLYRVALPALTVTERDYDQIPPLTSDGVPVPYPSGGVAYRDVQGDRGILLQSDFSWAEYDVRPFNSTDWGGNTARVTSTATATTFLFGTIGGEGFYLWSFRDGRWWVGTAGQS